MANLLHARTIFLASVISVMNIQYPYVILIHLELLRHMKVACYQE